MKLINLITILALASASWGLVYIIYKLITWGGL